MENVLNPVLIENHIRELVNRIAKGVKVVDRTYRDFLQADREFDRAFAKAYFRAEGSVKDRERQADLDTMEEREVRDIAEASFKHADKLSKALSDELRAFQSIGASIRMMYQNAGRGES